MAPIWLPLLCSFPQLILRSIVFSRLKSDRGGGGGSFTFLKFINQTLQKITSKNGTLLKTPSFYFHIYNYAHNTGLPIQQ